MSNKVLLINEKLERRENNNCKSIETIIIEDKHKLKQSISSSQSIAAGSCSSSSKTNWRRKLSLRAQLDLFAGSTSAAPEVDRAGSTQDSQTAVLLAGRGADAMHRLSSADSTTLLSSTAASSQRRKSNSNTRDNSTHSQRHRLAYATTAATTTTTRNEKEKIMPAQQNLMVALANSVAKMSAQIVTGSRCSRKLALSDRLLLQPTMGLVCAMLICIAVLVASSASAGSHHSSSQQDYSQQQQQQQQPIEQHHLTDELPQLPAQPQQPLGYQQSPAKTKKIQIVYIKVPLAKLRPSLGNASVSMQTGNDYGQSNYTMASNYTQQQRDNSSPAQSMLMSSSTADKVGAPNSNISQNSYGALPATSTGASGSSATPNTGNNGNYNGGTSGANGLDASSHGTSSASSYGTSGHAHSEPISSGTGYQSSPTATGASGGSSSFGSGTSTFGASAAFTDYPAASGNNQQAYAMGPHLPQVAQQSHQQGSNYTAPQVNNNNNNNNNLSQDQYQSSNQLDAMNANRMRQAKKTIIPIVVQVEHAIMDNAAQYYNNMANNNQVTPLRGNKYSAGRGGRGGKRGRHGKQHGNSKGGFNQLYGAATNDVNIAAQFGDNQNGAQNSAPQYINAANAHDINQITAAINAENAASAAAALAAADAAFGPSLPAFIGAASAPNNHNYNQMMNQLRQVNQQHQMMSGSHHRPQQQQQYHAQTGNGGGMYSSGALQSAASALLANTHPMIQAAASGGLASMGKLGAKLGEMIALPSIQMPAISQIGQSLPTALSSITNQMAAQVAKEHPMASAFARQVAQHAGIQLPPGFVNPSNYATANGAGSAGSGQSVGGGGNGQLSAAASSQQSVQAASQPQQSAQSQLLTKLGIGQSLQTAASQLLSNMKNEASNQQQSTAAANALGSLVTSSLLGNNPMALQSMNAALKQLGLGPMQQAALAAMFPNSIVGTGSGSDAPNSAIGGAQLGSQNPFQSSGLMQASGGMQFAGSDLHSSASNEQSSGTNKQTSSSSATGSKSSSFKSKFLSFFAPPKFISNLLSWNDRADAREDNGTPADYELTSKAMTEAPAKNSTTSAAVTTTTAAATTTTPVGSSASASSATSATSVAPTTTSVTSSSTTTSAKAPIAPATETPPTTVTSSKPQMSSTISTATTKKTMDKN